MSEHKRHKYSPDYSPGAESERRLINEVVVVSHPPSMDRRSIHELKSYINTTDKISTPPRLKRHRR